MKNKCTHTDCTYILFADDNQEILDLLVFYAEEKNWCYETAHNVQEIINKVNNRCSNNGRCFDLIVSDLHYFSGYEERLPRLTGVSAARSIRQIHPDLPIIFITGFSNPLITEEAEKYSNEIIRKPFDLDNLFDRIEYYLNWYSKKTIKKERRTKSINLTSNRRRSTDQIVEIDKSMSDIIKDIRTQKLFKTKDI